MREFAHDIFLQEFFWCIEFFTNLDNLDLGNFLVKNILEASHCFVDNV